MSETRMRPRLETEIPCEYDKSPIADLMERDPSLDVYRAGFVVYGRRITLDEAKAIFQKIRTKSAYDCR